MSEFESKLNGTLFSLMSWDQLTAFWARIDRDAGWYLYAVGQAVPTIPATQEQVSLFVQKIDALLRHEHDESYCGIVYADDLEQPRFIKIYDPSNLGVACGSSKIKVQPGWVMSLFAPVELEAKAVPANRTRWWHGLFSTS
ncbi:MAG: hypothetical protein ACYCYL_02125 [Acidithiobacillus sp.]